MAMFERRDRSAYYSSLRANSEAASNRANVKNTESRVKNSTTLARREQRNYQLELQNYKDVSNGIMNFVKTGLSIMGGVVKLGKGLDSIMVDAEKVDASVDMTSWLAEGDVIAGNQIGEGNSGIVENPDPGAVSSGALPAVSTGQNNDKDGSFVFKPSDEFNQWYDGIKKKIDESDYSSATKAAMQEQADNYYIAKVQEMAGLAVEQRLADYENSFSVMQQMSSVPDAQLYAEYDGNLPEGVFYQGIANIAGRNDWSSERKEYEAARYLQQVRLGGVQEKAVSIARTDGMAAADAYIQKQGFLSADEKISLTALSQQSFNQMNGIYTEQASAMMEEAFTSGGSTPFQIYSEYKDIAKANNLPDETLNSMIAKGKAAQREAVSAMGQNTLQADKNEGLNALYDGLEYLESGKANAWFYGMTEEKDKLIGDYKSSIAEYEKNVAEALDTSIENVQKMDKDVVTRFEESNNSAFELFDAGDINGEEYGQMVTANTVAALGESQTKDAVIVAGWRTALNKATDKYVETNFSDDVRNKVEALLVAEGRINSTKNKRTKEELMLVEDLIAETNGNILNALWDYGRKSVTAENLLDYVDKSYQSYVLRESVLGKDDESNIPLQTDDGVTMRKVIKAATESNSKITSNPEASYVWYDHGEAYRDSFSISSDDNGQITLEDSAPDAAVPSAHFLSESVETEYRRTASVYRSQLAMALGISESQIADNPEAVGENAAIASPVFSLRDGSTFRCRGKIIQKFVDTGTPGDGKGQWVPYIQISKDGTDPQIIGEQPDDDTPSDPDAPFSITASNVGDYIHLDMEPGRSGNVLKGVTINPELLTAANYTTADVYRAIKDIPELAAQWQMISRELKRLEQERDNSKEDEE